MLIGPGVGAQRIDAHGKVAVKADRQPSRLPPLCRGAELRVGEELQILEELDPVARSVTELQAETDRLRTTFETRHEEINAIVRTELLPELERMRLALSAETRAPSRVSLV